MLRVISFPTGMLQANCHVVLDPDTRQAIVVDPGDDADDILGVLRREGATASAIWLTHGHIDHVGAVAAMHRATGARIAIHKAEAAWLSDPVLNLAQAIGIPYDPIEPHHLWDDGYESSGLGRDWRIVHAPGHSPGSVLIHCPAEKFLLGGDLLIMGGIGRTDLPGGDDRAMAHSLKRALELEPGTRIFGGHGGPSTIARERQNNALAREVMAEFGLKLELSPP